MSDRVNSRRRLLIALGSLPVTRLASAQPQAKIRRIGFLEPLPQRLGVIPEFVRGMRALGDIEGTNVRSSDAARAMGIMYE